MIDPALVEAPDGGPATFEEEIHVTAGGASYSPWLMMICPLLGALPGVAALFHFEDGVLGGTLFGVGSLVGMGLGLWLAFLIPEWLHWLRGGAAAFHRSTRVRLGPEGLSIEGLGKIPWPQVQGLEPVPDSESFLVVHTAPHGRLLFQNAPVAELLRVAEVWFERSRASQEVLAGQGGDFEFQVVVFHWGRFRAWIWAGYALAGGVAWLCLTQVSQVTLFVILGMVFVVPLSAWLMWTIPFWQIGLFAAGRTHAFRLQGDTLRRLDGTWAVALAQARLRQRHARGIGYALDFVSIRSAQAKGLDLLVDDQMANRLMQRLSGGTPPARAVPARRPGGFEFRALVFQWRRFRAWIWGGYVAACVAGWVVLACMQEITLFRVMAVLLLLMPLTAWVVWQIPFQQIDLEGSSGRLQTFVLDGDVLRTQDGRWEAGLSAATLRHRDSAGIGYELEFMSIRLPGVKGMDLILDAQTSSELMQRLNQARC